MKLRKLIDCLTEKEQEELLALLKARFFGNKVYEYKLFKGCLEVENKGTNWDEASLVKHFFPDPKPNKKKYLRSRLSVLGTYIQTYLALKSVLHDKPTIAYHLVREINRRNCKDLFSSSYKKAISQIDKAPLKGFAHFASIVNLKEDELAFYEDINDQNKPLQFQETLNALDKAYIIKKLSLLCKANSADRVRGVAHEPSYITEIEHMAWGESEEGDKIVQLYRALYHITKEVSTQSDKDFDLAKKLFFELLPSLKPLGRLEVDDMFTYLINYCIISYNQKRELFGKELVELYKNILGLGVIEKDKKIDPHNFKNICSSYLMVNEFEAVEEFVQVYGKLLLENGGNTEATLFLCKGKAEFALLKYEDSLTSFNKAFRYLPSNNDPQLEAEIRVLRIRAHFKLEDKVEVEVQVKALQGFLKKKHLVPIAKVSAFKLFCKYQLALSRVIYAKGGIVPSKLEALKMQLVNNEKPCYAKRWLFEQIQKR